jgi:hypothetical protein
MLFGLYKTAEKLKKSGAKLWSKTNGAKHRGLDDFCTEENSQLFQGCFLTRAVPKNPAFEKGQNWEVLNWQNRL